MNTNNKLSLYFFVTLLLAALLLVLIIVGPYFTVFILSIVLGVIFRPLHDKILSKVKRPSISALLSTLIVLIIILGPVALIVTQIFNEAQNLYASVQSDTFDLNTSTAALQSKLQEYFPHLNIDIRAYIESALSWLLQNAGNAFSSAALAVLNLALSAIGLYYWFKDGEVVKKAMLQLSPLPDQYDTKIIDKLSVSVRSIIRGTIVVALIQGMLASIGFTIFGVPNAILLGTVTAICALIPGVGTSLVLGPAILYLFLTGQTAQGVGLLIWGMFAVGLIDNFLGPKLMSRGAQLHPFLILISVLGGIKLLGPVGFLAGPLALSLFFSLLDIYVSMIAKNDSAAA